MRRLTFLVFSQTLLKSEENDIEKAELQCLKNLFDLPMKTPTPAIIFSLGTLYTSIRVDKKRLTYLHKVLNREPSHWTRKSLETLEKLNIGWYKGIRQTLTKYSLTEDFGQIQRMGEMEWKNIVKNAVEKMNKSKIIDDCHKRIDGALTEKTKTAHILTKLKNTEYKRQPLAEITKLSKQDTKTLIIARNGMLECGKNFKGTMSELCINCNCLDDEEHRLNACQIYSQLNHRDNPNVVNFNLIFSDKIDTIKLIIARIETVWNLKRCHGSMNVA